MTEGHSDQELGLEQLTFLAVSIGASDIHLTPGLKPRFRINGELREIADVPEVLKRLDLSEDNHTSDVLRSLMDYRELPYVSESDTNEMVKLLQQRQKEVFLEKKSYNFSCTLEGSTRLRIHFLYSQGAVSVIIRLVPIDIMTPADLRIPRLVQEFIKWDRGLVLICGTQGQGKSTTLASLINEMNKTIHKHIVTIEDPVEFIIPTDQCKITQREIGTDSMFFSSALEDVLREDANICVVGEVRTEKEMETVLTLSEVGMLVFATIHAGGVIEAIERVAHMFKEEQRARHRLASVIRGAVCQQLLRRRDNSGRVLAAEVLVRSDSLVNTIKEGNFRNLQNEFQGKGNIGNISFDESIKQLKGLELV